MNILNIFTFKKDFSKSFSIESVKDLFNYAKSQILKFKELSHLKGIEKKNYVDKAVLAFIDTKFTAKNRIVQVAVDILKACVPIVTQFVYDCLKARIEGLTETADNV